MSFKQGTKDEEELLLRDIENKRGRNKRIKLEGYSSDSSVSGNEDEGENGGAKPAVEEDNGNDDDDDDDMFASDNEDKGYGNKNKNRNTNKLKGKIKSMNMKEFNIKLQSVDKDEHELLNLSNGEEFIVEGGKVNKNIDTLKKYKNDMIKYYNNQEDEGFGGIDRENIKKLDGPKMEAFSLDKESREGVFDEVGNYIRHQDIDSGDENGDGDGDDDDDFEDKEKINDKDQWLIDIKSEEISKARKAEELKQTKVKERLIGKRQALASIKTIDLIKSLLDVLEPVETSMEMLQRMYVRIKRLKRQVKSKRGQQVNEHELVDQLNWEEEVVKNITEKASMLQERGYKQVYDLTKEELMREFKRIGGVDFVRLKRSREQATEQYDEDCDESDSDSKKDTNKITNGDGHHQVMWEYRYIQDGESGNIYGPYDGATMDIWATTYFYESPIVKRIAGSGNKFL